MQNKHKKVRLQGTKHERAYQEVMKPMVKTPTLCRDCKHTIKHNNQCYSKPLMPCSIQLHETPTIAPTT